MTSFLPVNIILPITKPAISKQKYGRLPKRKITSNKIAGVKQKRRQVLKFKSKKAKY